MWFAKQKILGKDNCANTIQLYRFKCNQYQDFGEHFLGLIKKKKL